MLFRSMIAALLVIYGAGAESPAVIGREMLQQMMAGYRVAVSCEQESGEYKLSYMRVEQEESKE